ncbi:MAG: CRISPR-associated protein Cas4 [Euryarchaeota archaeon]|nr:CRISPR-associated protein Cas4 [Euryarchaeota archaeon]
MYTNRFYRGVKMQIRVSSISEYLYCPMKMYLSFTQDIKPKNPNILSGKLSHQIRRDFQEILKRNIQSIRGNEKIEEILDIIFRDVPSLIENTSVGILDVENHGNIDIEKLYQNLAEDLKLESWIISAKIKKILQSTGKNSSEIIDILFPPSLLEYRIDNKKLNLSGKIDKIEIINGIYYPIEIKTGKYPIKGVWEADAIQVAAYSVLIEEEFDTEVLVGFVEYLKINKQIPVVINSKLRKELFEVLDDIKKMFYEGHVSEIAQNINKCKICEYSVFCEYYDGS